MRPLRQPLDLCNFKFNHHRLNNLLQQLQSHTSPHYLSTSAINQFSNRLPSLFQELDLVEELTTTSATTDSCESATSSVIGRRICEYLGDTNTLCHCSSSSPQLDYFSESSLDYYYYCDHFTDYTSSPSDHNPNPNSPRLECSPEAPADSPLMPCEYNVFMCRHTTLRHSCQAIFEFDLADLVPAATCDLASKLDDS